MGQVKRVIVFLVLVLLGGCAAGPKPNPLPPGALNQFDATAYMSLMGTKATLESLKADYKAGNLPPSAKPALNKALKSYSAAEAAWQAYHIAKNGDQTALQAAVAQATTDVVALLVAARGGK